MRTARSLSILGLFLALIAQGCSCDDGLGNTVANAGFAVAEHDFEFVEVGATEEFTFTLLNQGAAPLKVTSVTVTGENPDWFTLDTEAFELGGYQDRPFKVGFRPLGEGAASIEVTFESNNEGSPLLLRATGEGFLPTVTVEPISLDFRNVVLETRRILKVHLANSGDESATITASPISTQAQGAPYERILPAGSTGNSFLLAAGAEADIDVVYSPSVKGRHIGTFTVSPCKYCQAVNVGLTGNGVESGLVVTPGNLNFGAVNPGITVTRPVTFENIGNVPVQVTRASLTSLEGAPVEPAFAMQPADLPKILEEGDSVEVLVDFSPTAIRQHYGRLVYTTSDPVNPSGDVLLYGTGGGPDIEVIPGALDFGRAAIGAPMYRRIQIANSGWEVLNVSGMSLTGDAYTLNGYTGSFSVQVGEWREFEIAYDPQVEGEHLGELVILTNDADELTVTVPVRGTAENLPPCDFEVAPASLNFGLVRQNDEVRKQFDVANRGADACLVGNIALTADTDPAYTLEEGTPSESQILEPGESVRVTVVFEPPTVDKTYTGAVSFYISNPDTPTVQVPLMGTSKNVGFMVTPRVLDFGVSKLGCATREQTFSIFNTGGGNIVFEGLEKEEPGVGGEFSFVNVPPVPTSIRNGDSIRFTMTYRARDLGRDTASVYVLIRSNGVLDRYLVEVSGEGSLDAIQTDVFTQLDKPQADILFVVDDSGSMGEEQQALGNNFGSFIGFAVDMNINYHLAVTSTDCDDAATCGLFFPHDDPSTRIVHPDLPDPEARFRANVNVGTRGSATEKGFLAAYNALSAPRIWDPNENGGFLRDEAYLAIVFVSDEPEQSLEPYTFDFYLNFFLSIKGFKNPEFLTIGAIVGPLPDGCRSPFGSARAGPRYIDMAEATGGPVESICTDDWATSLETLALRAFGYKSRFYLKNHPIPETIVVKLIDVEGFEHDATGTWTYDAAAKAIDFDAFAIPSPGDRIEVSYEVQCFQ